MNWIGVFKNTPSTLNIIKYDTCKKCVAWPFCRKLSSNHISKIFIVFTCILLFLLIDLGILNKEERRGQRDKKKKHTVWENGK